MEAPIGYERFVSGDTSMRIVRKTKRHLKSALNTLIRYNPLAYKLSEFLVHRRARNIQNIIKKTKDHPYLMEVKKNARATCSKEDIKNSSSAYTPSFLCIKGYSSGTTNSPITVYRSISSTILEEYFTIRHWKSHGYRFYDKVLVLRGEDISQLTSLPYISLLFENKVLFSSYMLSPQRVDDLIRVFEDHRVKFIQAYPSSAQQLAMLFKSKNYKPKHLKGIFTSSESWAGFDINFVEEQLAPVFDHYGQAERVAALQSCEQKNYHVVEDYSHVEFEEVESGLLEIIGTTYHNNAMPLWRYRTGDYLESGSQKNCPCGNPAPYVKKILGRADDYVISSDGTKIGRLDVAFKGIDNLIAAQVVQNTIDAIDVYCIPASQDSEILKTLTLQVKNALNIRLGQKFTINLIMVKEISRGPNGKFKSVVSNL